MNHHNSTVRHDALVGLCEIFSAHPELLPKNLPKLVEQVFSTIVDGSGLVRQASRMLIKCLTSLVYSDAISPFFDIMMAHLNCGLTHIKEKIQLDSLKILELYIQYHSKLLVSRISKVLPLLIGLLSRHKVGTFLTQTSAKLSIFSLISKMLESLLSAAAGGNFKMPDASSNAEWILEDQGQVCRLTDTLLTILMESWVECHSDVLSNKKAPSSQSLSLMQTIITLLSLLLKLLLHTAQMADQQNVEELNLADFCGKISGDVKVHMMCYFPFRVLASSTQRQLQQVQYDMNFTFCEVGVLTYKLLSLVARNDLSDDIFHPILEYLANLKSKHIQQVTASAQTLLVCSNVLAVVTPFVCELCHENTKLLNLMRSVLVFIRDFYDACHSHSRTKQLLVKCFSRILVDELAVHGCR